MKKITRTTVKTFIKKNQADLYINVKSAFSGMTDGCECVHGGFKMAYGTLANLDETLGVEGAWFVGSSRDYFTAYEDSIFTGIEVYNSCGKFILAVKK